MTELLGLSGERVTRFYRCLWAFALDILLLLQLFQNASCFQQSQACFRAYYSEADCYYALNDGCRHPRCLGLPHRFPLNQTWDLSWRFKLFHGTRYTAVSPAIISPVFAVYIGLRGIYSLAETVFTSETHEAPFSLGDISRLDWPSLIFNIGPVVQLALPNPQSRLRLDHWVSGLYLHLLRPVKTGFSSPLFGYSLLQSKSLT